MQLHIIDILEQPRDEPLLPYRKAGCRTHENPFGVRPQSAFLA